jgi:branched-chain amino acid transport system ATP-binding protein
MLKVDHISSGYGKKQVLFDISFEIKPGEAVLLTGGNGSGKSTILKCLYNVIPIWKGSIWFEDERIDLLKSSDLIRKAIVYIPQKDFCFDNLTVEENLQIAGTIYPKIELQKRIENVCQQTGLEEFKKRKPFNLSGGEKKLLAFGMGLIHKPKLILFDEPLAGVDAKKTNDLVRILESYLKLDSIAAVIVEHRETKHELFTDKICLELGKINKEK